MTAEQALGACLRLHHAGSRLRSKLDDELGTHHGLAWSDYLLLRVLAGSPAGIPIQELHRGLSLPRSSVLRQVLALEKTGWLQRCEAGGQRRVSLRPAGRRLLSEAEASAAAICAEWLGSGPAALMASIDTVAIAGESPVLSI